MTGKHLCSREGGLPFAAGIGIEGGASNAFVANDIEDFELNSHFLMDAVFRERSPAEVRDVSDISDLSLQAPTPTRCE
jgi:hypothetical protein